MHKILIIEDDTNINEMIATILQNNHYAVASAFSGSEALLYLKDHQVDLILLDLMLPGVSGETVLTQFNNIHHIPIIVLTAISDKQTITTLLRSGANDYMVKPFDYQELLARIEVQFRNKIAYKPLILKHKNMILDLNQFKVFIKDEEVSFSKRDFLILQTLLENKERVFTKENLYKIVWEEEYYGDENTINVHISNIRKKLKDIDKENEYIETIWGIGIRLHP